MYTTLLTWQDNCPYSCTLGRTHHLLQHKLCNVVSISEFFIFFLNVWSTTVVIPALVCFVCE